jgi:hypothetical protein
LRQVAIREISVRSVAARCRPRAEPGLDRAVAASAIAVALSGDRDEDATLAAGP